MVPSPSQFSERHLPNTDPAVTGFHFATAGRNPKVGVDGRSVCFAAVGAYSFDLDVSAYISTSIDDQFNVVQQELLLRLHRTGSKRPGYASRCLHKESSTLRADGQVLLEPVGKHSRRENLNKTPVPLVVESHNS